MKTAKQREQEFRADLAELLKKHGAELGATLDYEMDGARRAFVEVFMPSQVDSAGEVLLAVADFYL